MKKEILDILSDPEMVLFFNQIQIDWVANAEYVKELFHEFHLFIKINSKFYKEIKFNELSYNQIYTPTIDLEYQAKDIKYIVSLISSGRCTIQTHNRVIDLDANVAKQIYALWKNGNRIDLSYSDILSIIRYCKKHSFEEIKQLLAYS